MFRKALHLQQLKNPMRYLYVLGVFALLSLQAVPASAQTASASDLSESSAAGDQTDTSLALYNAASTGVDSSEGAVQEDVVALTEEQLANCYALYMPENVREEESEDVQTASDDSLVEGEAVSEEEETEVAYSTYDAGSAVINELVSDPQDGEEWMELYNPSSTSIDLAGWTITEGSGKTTPLPEQTLEPGAYLVVETIKGNLNNGGDSVTLTDGTGTTIDAMSYGDDTDAPGKGESLALADDGTWAITDVMTPGATNEFPAEIEVTNETYEDETASDEPTVDDTDQQDEYEALSDTEPERTGEDDVVSDAPSAYVKGVVTAAPGTFGSQIAFIDGMQLYFYHADWPELSVGDVVQVSGEPSTAYDESRVKISDKTYINIVGSQELKAEAMGVADVFDQDLGSLVQVSGEIMSIDGKTLMLADETGEIEIIANERTGMSWSDLTHSAYTITGVVRTRGGETKIYARDWNDVEAVETETIFDDITEDDLAGLTSADEDTSWLGAVVVGVSGGTLIYWFVRFNVLPEALKQTTASAS